MRQAHFAEAMRAVQRFAPRDVNLVDDGIVVTGVLGRDALVRSGAWPASVDQDAFLAVMLEAQPEVDPAWRGHMTVGFQLSFKQSLGDAPFCF